jgi:hypothetical protein
MSSSCLKSKVVLTSSNSVGRLQLLLPHRLSTVERRLLRHLLYRPAGFHSGLGWLLPQRRWFHGDSSGSQHSRWSLCFRLRHARLLHCGQPHVSRSFGLQLPHGRHEPVLQEEDPLIVSMCFVPLWAVNCIHLCHGQSTWHCSIKLSRVYIYTPYNRNYL